MENKSPRQSPERSPVRRSRGHSRPPIHASEGETVRRITRLQDQRSSKTTVGSQTGQPRKLKASRGEDLSVFDGDSDDDSNSSPIEEVVVNASEQATMQRKSEAER